MQVTGLLVIELGSDAEDRFGILFGGNCG